MSTTIIHRDAGTFAFHLGQRTKVVAFGLFGSPLSPWCPVTIDYRGQRFTSVAQLLAYVRAKHFRSEDLAEEILSVTDPRALRETARRVPADDAEWQMQMERVMPAALREMVAQNPDSLVALMATGSNRLAFAVQNDRLWGVGLAADDPSIDLPSAWPGRNLLGEGLEQLRDGYFAELLPLFATPGTYRLLDDEAIADVINLVEACFALASDLYDREFVLPDVRFDLKGTTAGEAIWVKGQAKSTIRFNPVLLSENWARFRDRTVPHEVAHLVSRELHGAQIRSHGPEWQAVMRDFGCETTRCHNYSVANVSTLRGKRDVMRCHCNVLLVSPKHSRAEDLRCRTCGKSMQFVISEAELVKRVRYV